MEYLLMVSLIQNMVLMFLGFFCGLLILEIFRFFREKMQDKKQESRNLQRKIDNDFEQED